MSDSIHFGGSIPENYDKYLGPMFFEEYAIDIALRTAGHKGISILEIASGTGRVTAHLVKKLPDEAKIMATDLNPDMIEIGKKRVTASNVEWKIADMLELPFEDSFFDLVICQFGIMFVQDKVKAFGEIHRVLKPGGKFLFSVWHTLENMKFAFHADQIINSYFKDNPVTFYQIPFSYNDEETIKRDVQQAGFKDVKIEHVKKETRNTSAEDAVKGLIDGNPVILGINERDPSILVEIKSKLTKVLTENFGPDPLRCSLHALVMEASK